MWRIRLLSGLSGKELVISSLIPGLSFNETFHLISFPRDLQPHHCSSSTSRPSNIPTYSNPIFPYESSDDTNTTAMPSHQLIFSPQYIQLSSYLPTDSNSTASLSTIYGLGEYYSGNYARNTSATIQTFWALDIGDPVDENMYGHHAVYMEVRPSSTSVGNETETNTHAVWLRNPSGMDVILRSGVIQYRAIGGTLDLYFYSGDVSTSSNSNSTSLSKKASSGGGLRPRGVGRRSESLQKRATKRTNSAISAIEQYVQSIGLPQVPPTWAFGYHQCRWGYAVSFHLKVTLNWELTFINDHLCQNISELRDVVDSFRQANIPLETQWSDIDWMDAYRYVRAFRCSPP